MVTGRAVVTSRILVGVLQAMNRDAKLATIFRASLSVVGVAVKKKLKKAGRFKHINGQVFPKAGYIAGASTLSGYLIELQRQGRRGDRRLQGGVGPHRPTARQDRGGGTRGRPEVVADIGAPDRLGELIDRRVTRGIGGRVTPPRRADPTTPARG